MLLVGFFTAVISVSSGATLSDDPPSPEDPEELLEPLLEPLWFAQLSNKLIKPDRSINLNNFIASRRWCRLKLRLDRCHPFFLRPKRRYSRPPYRAEVHCIFRRVGNFVTRKASIILWSIQGPV